MVKNRFMIIGFNGFGVRSGYVTYKNSNSTMIFNTREKAMAWILDNPPNPGCEYKVVKHDKELEKRPYY